MPSLDKYSSMPCGTLGDKGLTKDTIVLAEQAKEAYANGLVELYQRRTSDGVFDYLAVKKKHKHVPQVYGEPWKV